MVGEDYAHAYAARFQQLAAAGEDIHGEARFVQTLAPPGSRVLDAGCGTGRVAIRLSEQGYDVTGVDVDDAMVAVARELAPDLDWHVGDLATLDLGPEPRRVYDVIVLAGNVLPFIAEDDLLQVGVRLAAHTRPGGAVVCGFGLDPEHLPPGVPVLALSAYDQAMASAGFELADRHAGWDASAYDGGGYAVSVHRRPTIRTAG